MPLRGHNILIVEGCEPRREDLQRALEAAGAETLAAQNLEDAVRRAREYEFTAVVANQGHDTINQHVNLPVLVYAPTRSAHELYDVIANVQRMLRRS